MIEAPSPWLRDALNWGPGEALLRNPSALLRRCALRSTGGRGKPSCAILAPSIRGLVQTPAQPMAVNDTALAACTAARAS